MKVNQMRIFDLSPFGVFRTQMDEGGEIYFVTEDILEILNCGKSVLDMFRKHVGEGDIKVLPTLTSKGWEKRPHLSTRGLLRLLLSVKSEMALQFADWLEKNVLTEFPECNFNDVRFWVQDDPFSIIKVLLDACRDRDKINEGLRGVIRRQDQRINELFNSEKEE